ncbi:MAG: relaxase/mobilization nuclease domain-containing protein [Rhodobacterales bacterium]|nr:relaxase/mobilization nuclease domain-containing protein [Rhodobacterales bacterium]
MSFHVRDLLKRARSAPANVSALDAVMGEDWAIVDAGRARRARDMQMGGLRLSKSSHEAGALLSAHKRDVDRMRPASGGGGRLPGRNPQAVVKMIRNGGVSDAGGMQAQMNYLSREGTEPLERSEAFMGAEIDTEQMEAMKDAWRMPPEGSGRADRTSHFLASFPEGTDAEAAKRAGRAWAEEMFGSGKYGGDSYDYYTAFHTDRAHPHMHVIVYRRGLEEGAWLKVSQRGDLNYDTMRAVLVDVAAREGIELEATTRFARIIHDRPVPDAEYRRAAEEKREPVPPAHTRRSAILAAAALMHQSRYFATQAQLVEDASPEAARVYRAASTAAAHGGMLAAITRNISTREETKMNERVEAAKTEIRDNFEKMDRGVTEVNDSTTRMRLAREIAGLKADTAPLLSNPHDLVPFTEPSTSGRYRGFEANDPNAVAMRQAVETKVKAIATRYGTDPDATVERYVGQVPSKGLEQQFARAEVEERARSRVARGEGPEEVQARDIALTKMHREIATIYDNARSRDPDASRPQRDSAAAADRSGRAEGRAATGETQAQAQERARQAAAQDEAARQAAREADPIYQQVAARQAAERREAAKREEARRQQDRADAERSRRERDDNSHGR